MDNRYRDYDLNQPLLLSPVLQDWLPESHLARVMSDVLEELNLSDFYKSYASASKGGRPAYDPRMMVRLLAYGYCTGIYSSRRLEAKTHDDLAFRFLSADQHPDHDSIAAFRKRYLLALEALFSKILGLCSKAGMVKLGHVATDGSKVLANASKHKAMSYERMQQSEKRLEGEITELRRAQARELLEKANQVDAEEDALYGKGNSGDGIPEELARRERRLEVIRKAKAALEEEAREQAAAKQQDKEGRGTVAGSDETMTACQPAPAQEATGSLEPASPAQEGPNCDMGTLEPALPAQEGTNCDTGSLEPALPAQEGTNCDTGSVGGPVDVEAVKPDSKAQRNFTDPESRIMMDGATKSFVQAYNTQISVDDEEQLIVAARVTQDANDKRQLAPMLESIREELGRLPDVATADAGYFSEQNVTDPRLHEVDLYIPPERQKRATGAHTSVRALSLTVMSILGLLHVPTRTRRISRHAKDLQTASFLLTLAVSATIVTGPLPLRAPTAADRMRYKLRSTEGAKTYSRRKAVVEPVFGQIKGCRGFRRFSFRGLRNVAAEWKFVAAMHNLLKLIKFRARSRDQRPALAACA